MKPLDEIRLRLCTLMCAILVPLFAEYYPLGSGLAGFCTAAFVCAVGVFLGCGTTSFLIAFKKWWQQ